MSERMYTRIVQLSLCLLLTGASSAGVHAASPAASAQSEVNMNDLSILEHRFFSHAYSHDPAEKRLERLECLVFGSTREGSNADRMTRLMKIVATRSQQPLIAEKPPAQTSAQAQSGEPSQPAAKQSTSSKQYPILNTLEWKALKKTYPNESLDQRLDRLESKMFGQPAQTMAYADRVERLKKTVGIGLSPEIADGITSTGPMPKAQPRGGMNEMGGAMPVPLESLMNPQMNPLWGGMSPFGGDPALGSIQQMMQSMNRQMSEMHRMGQGGNGVQSWSGTWVQDPKTGQWVEMNSNRRGGPTGSGKINPRPNATTPGESHSEGRIKEVPGYADPNSI